jgi:hypothetical protein
MFDTEAQLERFGEKIRRQSRHRSLETNKKRAKRQSPRIVHVSVRQPKINQTNKSVNPSQNLVSVRYYFKISNIFNVVFIYTVLNNFEQSVSSK